MTTAQISEPAKGHDREKCRVHFRTGDEEVTLIRYRDGGFAMKQGDDFVYLSTELFADVRKLIAPEDTNG